MSYDRICGRSDGIISAHRARLLSSGQERYNQHAEIQEEYLDISNNEPHRLRHPFLMTFNGQRVLIP